MQDMTDPEVLYVDAHEGEPMQFESLCMECMENVSSSLWLSFVFVHGQDCKFDLVCELTTSNVMQGTTTMVLTKIPHFREVVVCSFECDHCGNRYKA